MDLRTTCLKQFTLLMTVCVLYACHSAKDDANVASVKENNILRRKSMRKSCKQ
ncbi:MAG: hypothetical protein LBM61_02605 [Prevotellaceae bacterium]|jgi:hypothetical protein|nr:hypothetical protein [Prevotellaceae bacterium]